MKNAVIKISNIISEIPAMPDTIFTEKKRLTIHKIVTSRKETSIASSICPNTIELLLERHG